MLMRVFKFNLFHCHGNCYCIMKFESNVSSFFGTYIFGLLNNWFYLFYSHWSCPLVFCHKSVFWRVSDSSPNGKIHLYPPNTISYVLLRKRSEPHLKIIKFSHNVHVYMQSCWSDCSGKRQAMVNVIYSKIENCTFITGPWYSLQTWYLSSSCHAG